MVVVTQNLPNASQRDWQGLESLKRMVDLHVHFREPGHENKETFLSGMVASWLGGVGTVVEMPNTLPPVTNEKIYLKKYELMQKAKDILVNYTANIKVHLVAAITEENATSENELRKLSNHTPLFKIFMANSTGDLGINYIKIFKALEILERLNCKKQVIFHAEDPSLIIKTERWQDHAKNRPVIAEVKAVEQVLDWSKEFNVPMHITHVSTASAAEILIKQKKVTWDVLPKHLFFNTDDIQKFGNYGVMNPPLRPRVEQERLLNYFFDEKIQIISSDHAPHTHEDKKNAVSGAPGVQETMTILIDLWLKDKITKKYLTEITYSNPKSFLMKLGLKTNEDDILIDPDAKTTITRQWIKSRCRWSLWQDKTFQGKICNAYPTDLEKIILTDKWS